MTLRALIVIAIGCASTVAVNGTPQQKSVWSGVFTDAQAEQGAAVYKSHCVSCHGEGLSGAEQVPALRGVTFGATWESVPLADLFDRMRKTMPPGKGGVVTRPEYAAVLAYVLKMNGMPAGDDALSTDAMVLGAISYKSNKP